MIIVDTKVTAMGSDIQDLKKMTKDSKRGTQFDIHMDD